MKKVRRLLVNLLVACFLFNSFSNVVYALDTEAIENTSETVEETITATEDFGENQVDLDAETITVEKQTEEVTDQMGAESETSTEEKDLMTETEIATEKGPVEEAVETEENQEVEEGSIVFDEEVNDEVVVEEQVDDEETIVEDETIVDEVNDEKTITEEVVDQKTVEEVHNPDEDFVLAYVEQDFNVKTLRHNGLADDGTTNIRADQLPSSFSLKDKGYVTGVRNQGSYGTCWAFATMASAESSALKKGYGSVDFSELHLAYYTYNKVNDPLGLTKGDYTKSATVSSSNIFNAGGDIQMASIILAGGVGFVNESTLPYGNASSIMNGTKPSTALAYGKNTYLLSNARWIDLAEKDYAKQVIMEYGAIATSYYESTSYYNSSKAAYYCNIDKMPNHGITIVGWDDNFSKNNFAKTPSGDGAWLVKNSWGSSSRNGGYFWISYYDYNISGFAVQFEVDPFKDLKSIYQYDGTGTISYLQFTVNRVKIANNYTCADDEILEKVGFFSGDANVNYTVYVYLNSPDTNPTGGKLVSTTQGTTVYGGYRTVDLDKSVYLSKGTKFSIVIELYAPTRKTVGIMTDSSSTSNYYVYHNECAAGQSMYQYSGRTTWTDMSNTGRTARIKAYTFKTDFKFDAASVDIFVDEYGQVNVKSSSPVTYTVTDPTIASIDQNGAIKGLKAGSTTIIATNEMGLSCSCVVNVANPFVVEGVKLVSYIGNLNSISIPEGIEEIGANALKDKKLIEVELPTSLKIIGDYSFANNNITEIIFTDNIVYVGVGAYEGNELEKVTIEGSNITFANGAFPVGAKTVIKVPESDWLEGAEVPATCLEAGHTAGHYYKNIPEINDFQQIMPLGHSYSNYVDDHNSTCSSYGTETSKCDRCDAIDVRLTNNIGQHTLAVKEIAGIKFDCCTECNSLFSDDGKQIVNTKAQTNSRTAATLVHVGDGEKTTLRNTPNSLIATGTEITVERLNGNTDNYLFYISGDVNGDGAVNSLDYVFVKNYIMGVTKIDKQCQILAADYNGDSSVNSLDYVKIKNYIMTGGK